MLQVLVSIVSCFISQTPADAVPIKVPPPVIVTKVPHLKDETRTAEIKENPLEHVTETFILCGGISNFDHFGAGYFNARETHTNFVLLEVGETQKDINPENPLFLYLKGDKGKRLRDLFTKTKAEKKGPGMWLVRAMVTIEPNRYFQSEKWNYFEVIDLQFAEDGTKWNEWLWIDERQAAEKAKQDEIDKVKMVQKQIEEDRAMKAKAEVDAAVEAERAKYREFVIDGETITAKYSGIVSGVLRLTTKDGKTISTKLDKLTKDEQSWIKEKKWLKPAKKK